MLNQITLRTSSLNVELYRSCRCIQLDLPNRAQLGLPLPPSPSQPKRLLPLQDQRGSSLGSLQSCSQKPPLEAKKSWNPSNDWLTFFQKYPGRCCFCFHNLSKNAAFAPHLGQSLVQKRNRKCHSTQPSELFVSKPRDRNQPEGQNRIKQGN